jgi:DUF4097 and DUF4098 domain-containing protein YvlB
MKKISPLLALVFPLLVQAADDDCRYRADRAAEASTDGVRQIVVKAGAGSLDIRGEATRRSMQATGVACASRENQLERLQIRVERDGDKLLVSTDLPDAGLDPTSWFGGYSQLHLTMLVPAGIDLDVDDASGEASIANIASARVTDSSGSLHIEHVKGPLEVDDGSGELTIEHVQGPVRVNDGSGPMTIEHITGDVTVASDGSGSIGIADVQGSVTIGNDGSGSIEIERVSGSVRIEDDGSGGIRVSHVKHNVSVEDDGSGEIVVTDVDGDFSVGNAGSGGVHHERVAGNVRIAGEDGDDRDDDEEVDADEKVERE